MKNKKYYIAYFISLMVLGGIWLGPKLIIPEEKTTEEFIMKRSEDTIFEQIIPSPVEEERSNVWLVLDNLNTILSVIVGGVNVYLISSHYRAKKRNQEPKEDPKRIRRIFDPEPFD